MPNVDDMIACNRSASAIKDCLKNGRISDLARKELESALAYEKARFAELEPTVLGIHTKKELE